MSSNHKHWPNGTFAIAPAGVGTGKYYGCVLRSNRVAELETEIEGVKK